MQIEAEDDEEELPKGRGHKGLQGSPRGRPGRPQKTAEAVALPEDEEEGPQPVVRCTSFLLTCVGQA